MIKCTQCSKTFSHRENLIRHSRNHKAVKPHICPVCNKGFSRSDLLAKHEKLHNKTSSYSSTRKQTHDLSTFEPSKRRKTTNDEFEDITVAQDTGSFSHGIPETETQILNSSGIVDVGENTLQAPTRLPAALSQSTIGCDTEEARLPYFDFLSFSQPWSPEILTDSSEWFSGDFYEALDETNGRGFNTFESYQPAFFPFGMNVLPMSFDDLGSRTGPSASTMTYLESRPVIAGISQGTSCPPLSPAQTSCEDRLPSREPPSHRQSHPPPEPMTLEKNDPLILDHDSTFDISHSLHKEVADLLNMNEQKNSAGYSPMPSLKIVNIFIGLFFRDFYPQSPVLHLPTTCTNNLPCPLIAIIIIIGAIHSKLKGSQRFATNALDCLRKKLHLIVENNNSLLGDLNIIYTSVLGCYTGLWCGNKRAFDIADNMRSAAVTYIRRLPRHQGLRNPSNKIHLKSQWSEWISHESQKRLQWFVYMVDNQFPSLHNMPAIIPIAEVMKWELPCDEEFWAATTAGRWKSILGSAPQPPGPVFAAAVAPFMWPREGDRGWSSHGIRLNPWSAYLVLTALSLKTFEHSQHMSTLNQISLYDSEEYNESDSDRPGVQLSPIMQPDFIVYLRRAILSKSYLSLLHSIKFEIT
ncbi:fungal-specific transcription factor domain-containing protein [Penicillium herquei]|nr:fungal-specific transcription factor domain-containing protein [Penicillium herquei]